MIHELKDRLAYLNFNAICVFLKNLLDAYVIFQGVN